MSDVFVNWAELARFLGWTGSIDELRQLRIDRQERQLFDNRRVTQQELDAMPPDNELLVTYSLEGEWRCLPCLRADLLQTIERAATGPLTATDFRVWVPGPSVTIQVKAVLVDKRTIR